MRIMRKHIRPFSYERVHLSDINILPSYIRIGKSKLPGAGRGLFATRSLPAGTPLTAYPGPIKRESNVSSRTRSAKRWCRKVDAYIMEIVQNIRGSAAVSNGGTELLTFQPDPADVSNGIAHLANDAIHPDVTGFSNNCDFIQRECKDKQYDDLYLCTSRAVRRGEELFADYMLPYWMSCKHLPKSETSTWIRKFRKIQANMNAMDIRLDQYMGDGEFIVLDPKQRIFCKGCESRKKRRIKANSDNIFMMDFECTGCRTNITFM